MSETLEKDELQEALEKYLPLRFVRDELAWALSHMQGARILRKLNLLRFRAEGIMLDGQKPRQRRVANRRDSVRLMDGRTVIMGDPMLIGPLTPQHRITNAHDGTTPVELEAGSRAEWEAKFRQHLVEYEKEKEIHEQTLGVAPTVN